MLRYGIVGCGGISRFHFHALKEMGAAITCVADINLEAAQKRAAEFGARAVKDYHELVTADNVDVVSIVCAGVVHKEIALAAIAAGKAVICEKTMTTCQEDSYEVAKAVQKAGTPFYVCYMKRFSARKRSWRSCCRKSARSLPLPPVRIRRGEISIHPITAGTWMRS